MTSLEYERDGAAIYAASFATIRREANLASHGIEPIVHQGNLIPEFE